MEHTFADSDRLHAHRLALALTGAAMVMPVSSLLGWLSGIHFLASYGAQFIPMAPSTAIGLLLLGLPLLMVLGPPPGLIGNRGAILTAGLVAAYGFLVFFSWLSGLPLSPDELLVKNMGFLGTYRIGQMSPATGFLCLLAGLSQIARILGQARKESPNPWLSQAALSGAGVLLAGTIYTLGYALGTPLLYGGQTIPVALPTAVSFLLLGGGLTTAAVFFSPLSGRWYRRLNDMPIGTQLRFGLGLIFAFVVLIGALAWKKTELISLQTKAMYDHPLQVRRAVGALEADFLGLRLGMRGLLLAADDQEIIASLQEVEIRKANALAQFEVLARSYQGPRPDLAALQEEFARWDVIRGETIRLLQAGKTTEAMARTRSRVGKVEADLVLAKLKRIDELALVQGDQLYHAAMAQNQDLNRELAVIVGVILLLSLIVAWFLLTGIKRPLRQLTRAAEHFRAGKMGARSGFVSANEFGLLSSSFNAMADTVETQLRLNGQAAQLAEIMLRETEERPFCRELLKALVELTGSQIGAIYLLNSEKTEFELFESLGLAAGRHHSFSATIREGEFGAALATGQMQRITEIPAATPFTFTTVSGEFRPREIVTLPLLAGPETVAVISLASIRDYEPRAIRLLELVLVTITARMNGVLAFRRSQQLAERLEQQNQALHAQQQEMQAQAQELTYQNTELERQKKQLDAANRLKTAFLANMSHELRTPLNSVIALSGVLGRRLATTIPTEEFSYLEVIERNGKNLLAMINNILDLSRIEAGREEINLGQFSLRVLIDEVAEMIEPQAREKEIRLSKQIADDLPPIVSDPGKVRHILQNLIANAVKFIESGSVEISARQVGGELRVAVHDTGIGIAAEQLDHIFEEFRQADGSTSRKYGGSGLGLAIAKKYATLLHGTLSVESTPGQGSTFTLILPLTLEQTDLKTELSPGDESAPAAPQPWGSESRGQSILLVEDNEPAVIQISDILASQGYRLRVAHNGKDALAQIAVSPPAAMILDLMMPEMDGFEVLRQLRTTEETAALPVLILTAKHVTPEELSVLRGTHIHQLIQKGDISRKALLEAVARMVASSGERPIPPAGPASDKTRQGRPVILVVEDNPDNLRTAKALLAESAQVIQAEDGRAGVEQARRHRPDLILMDLALPVMDGFAALAAIRADEGLRHIPVIAVTASAMMGDREAIMTHGFDGYISKPIDAELLQKTLREVLDGSE